jgi:hypothetical protein
VNRRLELKTDLLKMEGAGINRPDITEQLCLKYSQPRSSINYYWRTRHKWQREILGLSEGKQAYHQTLNRLEYIYQKFSSVYMSATESNGKIGALRGMLETALKKAEITGVFVPGMLPEVSQTEPFIIRMWRPDNADIPKQTE